VAAARPLVVLFAFLQSIHQRQGIEAGAPTSAEQDLIAELEAERKVQTGQ